MPNQRAREQILKEAWLGDAVLCLYARRRILDEDQRIDAPKAERMTSNQFLAAKGEPSEMEAAIGRVFLQQGLEAAFDWIEVHLMPIYERQENNRIRRLPGGAKRV